MADSGRTVFGGGGGASLGLPAPDFAAGWGPGFAFEANDPASFDLETGLTDFDTVYAIDASPVGTGTLVAEDNEWFEWDPTDAPSTTPVLKRSGFYYVEYGLNLDGNATEPVRVWATGSHKLFIPTGLDRGNWAAVLALRSGPISLAYILGGNTAEPTYASVALVPLFTP